MTYQIARFNRQTLEYCGLMGRGFSSTPVFTDQNEALATAADLNRNDSKHVYEVTPIASLR